MVIVPVPVKALSVWAAEPVFVGDPHVPLAWKVVPPSKESWLAVFRAGQVDHRSARLQKQLLEGREYIVR